LLFPRASRAADQTFQLFPAGAVSLSSTGEGHGFPDSLQLHWPTPPQEVSIRLDALEPTQTPEQTKVANPGIPGPTPWDKRWAALFALGTLGGSAWNSFSDGSNRSFHITDEGFWSRNTYAGGGDKASHFVSYNFVSRTIAIIYEKLDFAPTQAQWGGFLVSSAAGFVTELGDGRGRYGFSFEDWLLDTLGAGAALVTSANRCDDLIGFMAGVVQPKGVPKQIDEILGKDYSREIYTANLKIGGLARRLNFDAGPANFLLLGISYGVKGYPYALPQNRERQVGIQIGLNIGGILRALGVPDRTWWGIPIYMIFDTIQFPYTYIGYYYDLNHHRWLGPSSGQAY
jgi:hypothetical protein